MVKVPRGEFVFPSVKSVLFGRGSLHSIETKVKELDGKRVMLVTVPELTERSEFINAIKGALNEKVVAVFDEVKQHVPRPCVLEGTRLAKEVNADLLISLGGSSTADAAKGINLLVSEGEPFESFFNKMDSTNSNAGVSFDKPKLPHIAIPTSLSGGEFTKNLGITDPIRQRKDVLGHESLTPKIIILDPEVTVYTRSELWASSAMKIFSDCIDCFCSPNRHPFVEALAFRALQIINNHLIPSLFDPYELGSRAMLQQATWMSMYGGFIGASLIAAFRHQIGAIYNVMHGVASTIVLPHGIRFNRDAIKDGLTQVAQALELPSRGAGDSAEVVIARINELMEETDIPSRLRDVGIPEDGLRTIAEAVMEDARIKLSPRPIDSFEQISAILESAW